MIIVTRPNPDGCELVNKLTEIGIPAQHMPLFNIVPLNNATLLQTHLNSLLENDFVIAVSPQVILSLQRIANPIYFPKQVNYVAIGHKTAKLLRNLITMPVIYPFQENSEGLLTLPVFNSVKQKRILILRGNQGLELLGDNLVKRGARVSYIECYKRLPIQKILMDPRAWPPKTVITLTNSESLEALNHFIPLSTRHHYRLVVCSERIAKQASEHCWMNITISKSANNQILFKTILTLCHNEKG